MPNWCWNQMTIYGDQNKLEKFRKDVLKAMKDSQKDGCECSDLYLLFANKGYKEEDFNRICYSRGSFQMSEREVEICKGTLQLCFQTAWNPIIDAFNDLLDKHYKGLYQVTLAMEEGCELFINTDRIGRFYREKYRVYVEDCDEENFTNFDDVVYHLANVAGLDEDIKSFKQLEDWVEKKQNEDEDFYCCINEFTDW